MDRSPDGDPTQQSDLPIYRIDRALEVFNRRIDDLWGPRGLEGEFQFVQRAWRSSTEIESATDQSDANTNQFGSMDELQGESPGDFLERCEASSAYFLFTYFARRRGERVQSRPLEEETATLLREWIRESLKRDGIWDVFLNQIRWQSDIALNARREVRRRVRDGREIYHDLLQLFARVPILGYIPQIVHRSWWLHRKQRKEKDLDSHSAAVPEVAFKTSTVRGGSPLPDLSVKLLLPGGSMDVVQFGKEVLPKRTRDKWNDGGPIFQPSPDPEVLFGEKFDEGSPEAIEAEKKTQKIRLLYSFVLDRIYRGDEEEIGKLLDDITETDDAVQVAEQLEERVFEGRELENISFLWLPLMDQYGDKGGYGTLLGWLFARLPSETNPLYSDDRAEGQGQGIRLALEQLSNRIRDTYVLEAERQDLDRDEQPHRALAERVHFLGDYMLKRPEDLQEQDGLQIDLSRSDLDIRLVSTVGTDASDATYSVKFGPDVVPPPEKNTPYQQRLAGDFRSLHQSLQRIHRAEKSGEMRLQSAMSATFSHSYMKIASTLESEIKGLPEEGVVFSKSDLLNNISRRKIKQIIRSENSRAAMEELMRDAYSKSESKRDFSKVKRMFEYLYDRLEYFNDFLTSNMSTLTVEPGNGEFEGTISEDISSMIKKVIRTTDDKEILRESCLELGNNEGFRLKKPSFSPERKVGDAGELTELFSNILREGIWRELLMNAREAFEAGSPDPSDAKLEFYCEPNQIAIENWADNTVSGDSWHEVEIRKPHGEQGFGLYGVKVTAIDILQIADSVRYFERPSRSRVEISVRPGWIVSGN